MSTQTLAEKRKLMRHELEELKQRTKTRIHDAKAQARIMARIRSLEKDYDFIVDIVSGLMDDEDEVTLDWVESEEPLDIGVSFDEATNTITLKNNTMVEKGSKVARVKRFGALLREEL